jgi:hypothetical protein
MMGRDVLSGTSFIGATCDRVIIHFPRKRCIFVSIARAIRTQNRGAKRGGVYKILKSATSSRRNRHTMDKKLSTRSARSFAQSKKRKFWHKRPIMLSTEVLDRHLSEPSVLTRSYQEVESFKLLLTATIDVDRRLLGA